LVIVGNTCDRDVATDPTQGQGIYAEWYNYNDQKVPNYGTCMISDNVVFGNGGSFMVQTNPRNYNGQSLAPIVAITLARNLIDAFDHPSSLPIRISHGGNLVGGSMHLSDNTIIVRRSNSPWLALGYDTPYASGSFSSDHNHFHLTAAPESSEVISDNGTFLTFARWQARGHDLHSTVDRTVPAAPNAGK
jgi:hypothetical protein